MRNRLWCHLKGELAMEEVVAIRGGVQGGSGVVHRNAYGKKSKLVAISDDASQGDAALSLEDI